MTKEILYYSNDKNITLAKSFDEDSGYDLKSSSQKEICIFPGNWALVPTGITLYLPPSYEGQIRPRSGLALTHGITVLNSPGTIDRGYHGEIKVILINHSNSPYIISYLDRIAQIIFTKISGINVLKSDVKIKQTTQSKQSRENKGFGSSGIK